MENRDVDLESESGDSTDSFCIDEVMEMVLDEDGKLCYLCHMVNGTEEIFDRSDLMDSGCQQRLVLQFERQHPPPWDSTCSFCDGEGCEECVCEECERPCRHLNGINYGCCKHPVI